MKTIVKIGIAAIMVFMLIGLFSKDEVEEVAVEKDNSSSEQSTQDIKIETEEQLWRELSGIWVNDEKIYYYFHTNENNENILTTGALEGDKTSYKNESLFFSTNVKVELLLSFTTDDGTEGMVWKNARLDISDYKNGRIKATLPYNGDDDDVKVPQSAEYKEYIYMPDITIP